MLPILKGQYVSIKYTNNTGELYGYYRFLSLTPNNSFTQEEFLNLISSNRYNDIKIGDIVNLNNNICSRYIVIGKNHDNTANTVDLMQMNCVETNFAWADNDVKLYKDTNIRNYLNNDFINCFDNTIKSKLKYMKVKCGTDLDNGYELSDKAKIISLSELNFTSFYNNSVPGYGSYKEGTGYEYFIPERYNYGFASNRYVPSLSNSPYVPNQFTTRSMLINNSYFLQIDENGNNNNQFVSANRILNLSHVIIRF